MADSPLTVGFLESSNVDKAGSLGGRENSREFPDPTSLVGFHGHFCVLPTSRKKQQQFDSRELANQQNHVHVVHVVKQSIIKSMWPTYMTVRCPRQVTLDIKQHLLKS